MIMRKYCSLSQGNPGGVVATGKFAQILIFHFFLAVGYLQELAAHYNAQVALT